MKLAVVSFTDAVNSGTGLYTIEGEKSNWLLILPFDTSLLRNMDSTDRFYLTQVLSLLSLKIVLQVQSIAFLCYSLMAFFWAVVFSLPSLVVSV
jgi:hypothetical protein